MTAQVVTTTEENFGHLKLIKWDWLSTDAGAVSSATTYAYKGQVMEAVFIPDGGDTAPTAAYDVTILDGNSLDVLAGAGADLSATATTYKLQSDLGCVANDTLTLTVANAGDANGGIVYLFIADLS